MFQSYRSFGIDFSTNHNWEIAKGWDQWLRGILRNLTNIYKMEHFDKNSEGLREIQYFHKTFHLKMFVKVLNTPMRLIRKTSFFTLCNFYDSLRRFFFYLLLMNIQILLYICFIVADFTLMLFICCVYIKRIMLCNCLGSSPSRFSASRFRDFGFINRYFWFWKSLTMANRGGGFSFFRGNHVRIDIRLI